MDMFPMCPTRLPRTFDLKQQVDPTGCETGEITGRRKKECASKYVLINLINAAIAVSE